MSSASSPMDRRLTYGVLIAVVVHFAGILIWAGGAAERLTRVEQANTELHGFDVRLARVEARLDGIGHQLERIEQRLEDER